MGLNRKIIDLINNYFLDQIHVSFTFLNIVSMKNLKKRLNKRKNLNKYDKFNINFYNRVQKGFVKVSKNNKKYLIINSNDTIKENEKIILNKIKFLTKIK